MNCPVRTERKEAFMLLHSNDNTFDIEVSLPYTKPLRNYPLY